MSYTAIIFVVIFLYVGLGVLVTIVLSQTPYADNPWWVTTLFWPIFIVALFS